MKKSILLFILWAAFGFVLTCIYMAVMMPPASDTYITGWILFLITAIISPLMMFLIRKQAKSEKITWLAVVSKILLIFYSAVGAAGLLIYILTRLLA